MNLFKMLLLPVLMLLVACNAQNTKSISANKIESEQILEELIKLKQNAQVAYQNRDWNKAVEYYGSLSQRIPNDAEIWFRLGNSYARLNKHGAAIQSYQQALNRDPRNSKTWHNLGIVQLKLAANTFVEMQSNINADDPLNRRATYVINAITNLLEHDFGVSSK
jgi:tetratricopeptide (TPR) repeat protein